MSRYFDGVNEEFSNERFSRIVIRTDDPHTAYFINDENKQLYSAKMDESLKNALDALYAEAIFTKLNRTVEKQNNSLSNKIT